MERGASCWKLPKKYHTKNFLPKNSDSIVHVQISNFQGDDGEFRTMVDSVYELFTP